VLQAHVSHSRQKTMSPGRFSSLLRHDLEVSKDQFWACIRTGKPVDRPVVLDAPATVEHDAWVVAVLAGELHLSPQEIERLGRDEARGAGA
jgi:carotenoid cleavage dioxygenase-like enzyme